MHDRFVTGMLMVVFCMGQALFHYALDPQKKVTQYVHDVWGFQQGLPQSTVYSILQTRDGYLWLGTEEGLVRFDGVRFEVFNKRRVEAFSSNSIWALCRDREDNLWIGTGGGGLTRLGGADGTFTHYSEEQGLANASVSSILEDRGGGLWIATEGGLNRLENGEFTTYTKKQGLSGDFIQCLYEDRQGDLWIGTAWNGLNRMNPGKTTGKFTKYTTEEGLSQNSVYAIHEDREGDLWVGTDDGLNRLKDGKITVYTTTGGLPGSAIRAIREDREGNLWIGTYGRGVTRMNRREKNGTVTFSHFSTREGLSDDQVWAVYEDREGGLWVGTQVGLNRLRDGKFTNYTTREGLSENKVWCVMEDREGGTWFGTENGGLNRLKDGNFTTYTTEEGLTDNTVWSLLEGRRGELWIGTQNGGLNRLDSHKKNGTFAFNPHVPKQGLSDNGISAICQDRGGSLWLATYGWGLKRYKNGAVTTFTKNHGLSDDRLLCIHEDREGNLWTGTYGGGLNRLDPKRERITSYTTEQGLSNGYILAIHEDEDGGLWFGTEGGLNRLKGGTFTHVTVKQGLFNDTAYVILEDAGGNFWMSCDIGIYRVAKKELDDCCDGKINTVTCKSYDDNDGMSSRECYGSTQPAGWKSRDGKFWFPTFGGVSVIDPEKIDINPLPPPVVIEAIVTDDKTLHPPFPSASKNGKPVFPPGIERVEIHYTGLSFAVPVRVRFRCILEGFDKQWRDMDTRRAAYYTKLPPGHYTFRVTACNNDGIWNDTGASLSFRLKPFFYQTTWFQVSAVFCILFLGFGIFRLRVRQLTQRKIQLERLVDERTHQLKRSFDRLEEVNRELEKLSIVASETHNAVLILDAEGNLEWMNDAAVRMYGYTMEQLIEEKGENIIRISAHPNIRGLLDNFRTEPKALRFETLYGTRDGKKIWVLVTWTPILDHKGNLIKIVSIGSDISKLKQSEDKIRKQNKRILAQTVKLKKTIDIARKRRKAADEANRAKSEFLARMSHELRTPMNGVVGFTEMLLDSPLNDEQLDYARTISRSSEALTVLLNDILDFSRVEAGELVMTPIDFDPEVTAFDVCDIMLPRLGNKPVELLCRIGDNVPAYVTGDAGRFRQVLINLVGNAVKFTEKGEIELCLEVAKEEKERIKFHVTVRDTGPGVPKEKQEAIFDVFHQLDGSDTRKYEGTGLGLAIARQIAQLMKGNVWVENRRDRRIGSAFHFTAWLMKSTKEPEKERKPHAQLKGKKALVVDDNPNNLEILTHLLERSGMRVVPISGGENVVPLIREHFHRGEPFHIGIVDILMPGISGFDTARKIRELEPPMGHLPLLAFSSATLSRSSKLKESGFDGFLPKPIRGKKLVEMAARLLIERDHNKDEQKREAVVTRHTIADEAKHSIHIMVVEDNPINRKLAQFMLTRGGYRLTMVNDGKEALDAYTAQPDAFDLILMDIQMPRMNGLEATKEIRKLEAGGEGAARHIPIVALTAQSVKGDREKCLEAGMDDYISKPIRRETVFGMIKKWAGD